jgi:hypothetical protein
MSVEPGSSRKVYDAAFKYWDDLLTSYQKEVCYLQGKLISARYKILDLKEQYNKDYPSS